MVEKVVEFGEIIGKLMWRVLDVNGGETIRNILCIFALRDRGGRTLKLLEIGAVVQVIECGEK